VIALSINLRRLLAFIIDLCVFGIPIALLVVAAFLDRLVWNTHVSNLALLFLALTFSGSEAVNNGQSPGKKLLQIRVCRFDGQPVRIHALFLRASIVFLLLVVVSTCIAVFRYAFGSDAMEESPSVKFAISTSCLLIIPISIVIGLGRIGLHDFFAKTMVVRIKDYSPVSRIRVVPERYIQKVIAVLIFIFLTTEVGLGDFWKSMPYATRVMTRSGELHDVILHKSINTGGMNLLYQQIENAGLFVHGVAVFKLEGRSARTILEGMSFTQVVGDPRIQEVLRSRMASIRRIIRVEVNTTHRGMQDDNVQDRTVSIILKQVAHNSDLVVVEFVRRVVLGNLLLSYSHMVVGGELKKNGAASYFVVKPDKSNSFGGGISFM